MFQDSAGTTPVTAVEQPVGLLLDKSQGLIPGNNVAPAFVSAGTGWTVTNTDATHYATFSDGSVRFYVSSSTPITVLSTSLTANKYYLLTFTTTQWVSGQLKFDVPGTSITIPAGVGTYQVKFYSVSGSFGLYRSGAGVTDITFSSILLQEVLGNHATQATGASRPVLSARVNLLTKTEQFDDAVWTKTNATISAIPVAAPDNTTTADTLTADAGTGTVPRFADVNVLTANGAVHTVSIYAKAGTYSFVQIYINNQGAEWANFTLSGSGTAVANGSSTAAISDVGSGWYRLTMTYTAGSTDRRPFFMLAASGTATRAQTWNPVGTETVYFWGADLRVSNDGVNLPVYQRVNTSTDYDTTGFPYYLSFDGSDDSMATNTITPGIDKAQVFSGVRKLSDTAVGMIAELSADINSNNGSFAYYVHTNGRYIYASNGTAIANATSVAATTVPPITNVLTGLGDVSGDISILRLNGTQVAASATDQGTGNYLAYPLYIGRRNNATLPLNGRIYSLIARFGANLDVVTINNTEVYVSGKMGGGYVSPITGYDFLVDANGDQITDASDNPLFTQVLYT
jgi:hypothetical protein